jgi:hypothetical protein
METVQVKINIPLAHLNDIIICALEGGSNYWYLLKEDATEILDRWKGKYNPLIHGDNLDLFYGYRVEAVLPAILAGEKIPIHDDEDPDGDVIGYFSLENLRRGLEIMAEKYPEFLRIVLDEDCDYDAGDADAIVQLLTLGEIVYG